MANRLPQPGGEQRDESKFIVFEQFEKMNTQSVRQALSEKELAWLENLQPIAGNNLATVPAVAAAALTTISETISLMFYVQFGGNDYFIAFTTAGAAYSINIANGASSKFAPDGTFSAAPDVTTWQATRVLINDSKAGYCTFDGTLFVQQGGVSPNITVTNGGSGYGTTPPTVTISGGSGTGATAIAVVQNGSVIQVVLTNPGTGYKAGDTLTVAFSSSPGSGATGHVTMSGFNIASLSLVNNTVWQVPHGPAAGTYSITFTGGGGSGAAGTVTVGVVTGSDLTVTSFNLSAQGSGYTSAPACTWGTGFSFSPAPTIIANLGTETVASIVLDTGGSSYSSPPGVSIVGGSPSVAATAHSTESGGAVTSLVLDTAGSGYTSTPSVIIGTGSGATAIAHVWPFVPGGTTLAVFQGRVWLNAINVVSGGVFNILAWTGTGASYGNVSYDDFLPADASGALILSDADLIHSITALRSLNNYLWIMGDQSVKQIGNISLNGAGTITLFTILTISSDQGTIYPKSCISYNRIFMFANQNGIYGVFGSSVQKLSGDMDGIFKLIDFTQVPQGALADITAIHNAVFLVRYKDPLSTTRSILLTFDGKRWFIISQGSSLTTIATSASLSTGQLSLYGSSGPDVTQLLARPTVAVSYKIQSSLTHHGNAVQRKRFIRCGFSASLVTGTTNVTQAADTENGSTALTVPLTAGFGIPGGATGAAGAGTYLGMTLTGSAAGLTITNMLIEMQEGPLWGG